MRKREFLNLVERFLKKSEMSPTSFGARVLNDPTFIIHLRDGRECREATQEKVLAFMKDYAEQHWFELEGL